MSVSKDRMLPTRLVCERYSITDRTVDRWLEAGVLPPPVRINGLRYWRQRELEQHERQLGLRKKQASQRSVDKDNSCWQSLGDAAARVIAKVRQP
jgi:predicted DNA-binding transcriptional regulator AlpA